jgi:hypothetical protein
MEWDYSIWRPWSSVSTHIYNIGKIAGACLLDLCETGPRIASTSCCRHNFSYKDSYFGILLVRSIFATKVEASLPCIVYIFLWYSHKILLNWIPINHILREKNFDLYFLHAMAVVVKWKMQKTHWTFKNHFLDQSHRTWKILWTRQLDHRVLWSSMLQIFRVPRAAVEHFQGVQVHFEYGPSTEHSQRP